MQHTPRQLLPQTVGILRHAPTQDVVLDRLEKRKLAATTAIEILKGLLAQQTAASAATLKKTPPDPADPF
jgi:hypothetical protein